MGRNSNIQWTDSTHNIARGCDKVVDETPDGKKVSDCQFCYMYRDSFDGSRYNPREVVKTKTVFDLPLKYKKTKSDVWGGDPLMFTSSLTDVYHIKIDSFRDEYWDIARKSSNITKQILTKRPERINLSTPQDFLNGEFTKSIWIGTSVGSQYGVRRIYELINSGFTGVTFLSAEPLWSSLVIPDELITKLKWVIIGGESGNNTGKYRFRECKLEWIESLIEQCRVANVPVFVKQLGTHLAKELKLSDRHGGEISEWPQHLQIRQFPSSLPAPVTPLVPD